MPVDPNPPASDQVNRRLNGWKEIAAHLGKGVRTVQRWEKEYGLPVRRLGKGGSEIVFAFTAELDRWQRPDEAGHEVEPSDPGAPSQSGADPDPTPAPVAAAPAPPELDARRFVSPWLLAGVLLLVALAVGLGWWYGGAGRQEAAAPVPARAAEPASCRVDLDTLIVSDAAGHELWRHRFPVVLAPAGYVAETGNAGRHVVIADIDGDGVREVLFVVQSAGDQANHRLYCFNHDGTLRWVAYHDTPVRFGTVEYNGPFGAVGVYLTHPQNGTPSVWMASANPLFPSVLERLDPRTGRPMSAYWSNGHITTVAAAVLGSRPVIFVGSANNETKGAALVVLDPESPNGSTPAVSAHYRCTSCPPGGPLAFVVFPKPRRFAAAMNNQSVEAIQTASNGVSVSVLEVPAGDPVVVAQAMGLYSLDSNLAPLSFDVNDDYATASAWVLRRLGEPVPAADPRTEHEYVMSWRDGRFVKLPIPRAEPPR